MKIILKVKLQAIMLWIKISSSNALLSVNLPAKNWGKITLKLENVHLWEDIGHNWDPKEETEL